jgi:hypothetical protein
MCPVCVSTAVLVTAGVSSAGGIATLVVSRLRGSQRTNDKSDVNNNEERKTWPTAKDTSR